MFAQWKRNTEINAEKVKIMCAAEPRRTEEDPHHSQTFLDTLGPPADRQECAAALGYKPAHWTKGKGTCCPRWLKEKTASCCTSTASTSSEWFLSFIWASTHFPLPAKVASHSGCHTSLCSVFQVSSVTKSCYWKWRNKIILQFDFISLWRSFSI